MELRNLKAGLLADNYADEIRRSLATEAPDVTKQSTLLRLATQR
jgi:hypothetical protein